MSTRARGRGRQRFPVGVYATLLLALLALLQPRISAPVERGLRAVAALPFRAWGRLFEREAVAASAARSISRARVFWRRTLDAEQRRRPADVPPNYAPLFCAVRGRRDGDRLELDCAWSEIDGCESFVTVGATLVGFLEQRGGDDELVEVALLRSRESVRPVPALCDCGDGALRFVVEPAATIDPWPLRCALIDDPYAAARVQRDGQPVVTAGFADDPLGFVPAGLRIGELRIWGYDRGGGVRMPIGFFVDPAAVDERGSTVVTLWRRDGQSGVAAPRRAPARVEASAYALAPSRWFAALPFDVVSAQPGHAVVDGNRLVGIVSAAGPGHALVEPLGVPGRRLDTVFVPVTGAPVRLLVRVGRGRDRDHLAIEVESGAWSGATGALFTNAAGLPPGLWLGDVEAGAPGSVMQVVKPPQGGRVAVLVDEDRTR